MEEVESGGEERWGEGAEEGGATAVSVMYERRGTRYQNKTKHQVMKMTENSAGLMSQAQALRESMSNRRLDSCSKAV